MTSLLNLFKDFISSPEQPYDYEQTSNDSMIVDEMLQVYPDLEMFAHFSKRETDQPPRTMTEEFKALQRKFWDKENDTEILIFQELKDILTISRTTLHQIK